MADAGVPDLSAELQDLFQYVQRYTPTDYKLDFKLQPFLPDFVPSLGQVDDQIKVPRPDGQPDFLGLTCTDEPALKQSDPALLALRLRHKLKAEALNSQGAAGAGAALSLAEQDQPLGWVDPSHDPAKVDSWVDACSMLHQGEASTASVCSDLVDMEALLQPWPPEQAALIRSSSLPDPKQDTDLRTFARLVCNVVDIPPSQNPVESLHALFALFLELKAASPALQRQHLFDGVDHGAELE